jgi:small subunit ribosomal protein S9
MSIIKFINLAIGRRKTSTARVFLKHGTGKLIINKVSGNQYLQNNLRNIFSILKPLQITQDMYKYDIYALVSGGGLNGQSDAIKLGLSRLLCKIDSKNRTLLKPMGFLTCDSRTVERKKYGLKKARKAPQYSKR